MSRATQETCPASQSSFVYRALTVCGRSFQIVRLEDWFLTRRPCGRTGPYNPAVQARRFGLFRVRSPLLTESLLFSFPAGTEMVHFPALSSTAYVFSRRCPGITPGGFPHSEIFGSTLVCSLPKLIAACRVLHRLLAPRHPPYALSSLTFNPRNRMPPAASGRGEPLTRKNPTPPEHLTHYVLWSEKLPFAGYSVVKDRRRPAPGSNQAQSPPQPFRPLPVGNRLTEPAPGGLRGGGSGGEYRARTGDLLVANQALSQLS